MKTPSPETIAAIVRDYEYGVPVTTIAVRYGWSANSVRNYARAAGIGRRRRSQCSSCSGNRIVNPEGMCNPCAEEIALTGGHWVYDRRRGVQVWQPGVTDVA